MFKLHSRVNDQTVTRANLLKAIFCFDFRKSTKIQANWSAFDLNLDQLGRKLKRRYWLAFCGC